MPRSRALLSPEYPVIYDIAFADPAGGVGAAAPWEGEGTAFFSLALLVEGIPSFLSTIPVDRELVAGIRASLDAGDVQVAVTGVSVRPEDLASGAMEDPEDEDLAAGSDQDDAVAEPWAAEAAWRASAGTPAPDAPDASGGKLPAAHLSLRCRDGRRLGVARIVSRDRRATPEDVARYVLRQITSGVQIGDLASAG